MGTLIFVACALWFLTDNFPETFGFIGTIFSFIWDIVGNIVMFFVGILSKFLSIFGFLEDALELVLTALGSLLTPVLEVLPDSPLVPFLGFLLLGALFLLLKRWGDDISAGNVDQYVKLTYAWSFSAFNLGMIIAASGNPLGWMSGAIDTYIVDFPMTMLNYASWTGFARTMLNLTLLGGLITSLIFGILKGLRSFTRTWVGLAFCGMLGYEYMSLRLVVTHWLKTELGFIGGLLNIPIGFAEFLIVIQFFFGIVVFVLPMGAITALNAISQESAYRSQSYASTAYDDDFSTASYPVYVKDDNGNQYSVSIDGDYLYIYLPNGRISTRWEYVKGQPYFDLNGIRFYPYS